MKTPPRANLRLRLTAAAESIVRQGHPWVFAKSVREENRPGATGELAALYDRKDKFLAIGLYDAEGPIRVRILHAGKPRKIDRAWWQEHAAEALKRRGGLFDPQTTGYRCINGENDGWPGLVLDQYNTTRVMKIYAASWLPRLEELAELLAGDGRLVLRLSRNIQQQAEREHGLTDGTILRGDPLDGPVIFQESGLRFEADVLRGQKTGFFLDQRENRRLVETLAPGRSVLNLFSYTGGFSLYAARGGATSVCNLDISEHALAAVRRNFALNADQPVIVACRVENIQADAFAWLRDSSGKKFDLVVLDPPSLAKREAERADAAAAYAKLIEGSIARVNKNGILVAASCSAHIPADEFFQIARLAAQKSGRKFHELRTTGHPPDHPATFPEGAYLKCVYFSFPD